MKIESLVYFLVVCNTHSITKAAISCDVTQQTISAAIQRLELEFGQPLFSRNKFGVEMTDYAKKIYPTIKNIIESWHSITQSNSKEEIHGTISFTLTVNFSFFISDILAVFANTFPKATILLQEVQIGKEQEIFDSKPNIVLYSIPVETLNQRTHKITEHKDYTQKILLKENIVAIVGKNSSFAKYKTLPQKAIKEWPWIIYSSPEDDKKKDSIRNLIWKDKYPFNVSHVSNYSALFDSIIYHNYIAIASSSIRYSHFYKQKQLSIIKMPHNFETYCVLAIRKDTANSILVKNLISQINHLFNL